MSVTSPACLCVNRIMGGIAILLFSDGDVLEFPLDSSALAVACTSHSNIDPSLVPTDTIDLSSGENSIADMPPCPSHSVVLPLSPRASLSVAASFPSLSRYSLKAPSVSQPDAAATKVSLGSIAPAVQMGPRNALALDGGWGTRNVRTRAVFFRSQTDAHPDASDTTR